MYYWINRLTEMFRGRRPISTAEIIGPPRYRYVAGMEKPDQRYHPIPGPEARRREEESRAALRGETYPRPIRRRA